MAYTHCPNCDRDDSLTIYKCRGCSEFSCTYCRDTAAFPMIGVCPHCHKPALSHFAMVRKAESESDSEEETEEPVDDDAEPVDDSDGDDEIGDEPEDDSIRLSPADLKDFRDFQAQKLAAEEARERERKEAREREIDRLHQQKLEREKNDALIKKHSDWVAEVRRAGELWKHLGPKGRAEMIEVWAKHELEPDLHSEESGIHYWVCKSFDHSYGPSDEELDSLDESKLGALGYYEQQVVRVILDGRREKIAADWAQEEKRRLAREEAYRQHAEEERKRIEELEKREREWSEKQRRVANNLCQNCGGPRRADSLWDLFKHRNCETFKP